MNPRALVAGDEQAIEALRTARGWIVDVDGCIVQTHRAGGQEGVPFPGAVELVATLKRQGRQVIACTNASEYTPAHYAAGLRSLGFDIEDAELATAGWAGASHIAARYPGARVLALGAEGIAEPLRDAGHELVEAGAADLAEVILVGGASSYAAPMLDAAARAVEAGAEFYVTAGATWFHGGGGRTLAFAGAIAASISWATGVQPTVVGKPSPALAASLRERLGLAGDELAVIGDSAAAEMRLAHALGAVGVLVLSGATRREELEFLGLEEEPDLCVEHIGQLHVFVADGDDKGGES